MKHRDARAQPLSPYFVTPPRLLPPTSRSYSYDDFSTIDWARDTSLELLRQRTQVQRGALYSKVWDAASGWVLMSIIGMACGVAAGLIDIGAEWLSDLKEGICPRAFWLSRKQCCWAEVESLQAGSGAFEGTCELWRRWSPSDSSAGYAARYFMFILIAVAFAWLCASLVKRLAPYAAGSGIPEVKTILSGFVIRGYFDLWTLMVKATGMVLAVAAGLSLGKEVGSGGGWRGGVCIYIFIYIL